MTKRKPGIDVPLEVLGQFRIIFKTVNRHFDNIEKSTGVSGPQIWALAEICDSPGITVSELTAKMSLHQSTTSNLLEKLESNGLVKKIPARHDKRVVSLELTKKGQAILNKSPGPLRGVLPEALKKMDKARLVKLQSSLDELIGIIEEKSSADAKKPLRDI